MGESMWLCRTCQEPCSTESPFCSATCKSEGGDGPCWLLHREANYSVGPFSTYLDAITAREVALAPEVFEVLGNKEFHEYLDVERARG